MLQRPFHSRSVNVGEITPNARKNKVPLRRRKGCAAAEARVERFRIIPCIPNLNPESPFRYSLKIRCCVQQPRRQSGTARRIARHFNYRQTRDPVFFPHDRGRRAGSLEQPSGAGVEDDQVVRIEDDPRRIALTPFNPQRCGD